MLKILNGKKSDSGLIEMKKMKPCQIGIVESNNCGYKGHYVMRTQSTLQFEVIDLSDFREDLSWGRCGATLKVRLLKPDEKLTIEIWNEE